MSSIPIDILRHILEHCDKAGLSKMCLLNKVCCFCSQDFLYRDIQITEHLQSGVYETLSRSTDLAKRVRSFEVTSGYYEAIPHPGLQKSLRNMIYLRHLQIPGYANASYAMTSLFDGCTFDLVSFTGGRYGPGIILPFLYSQKSLTNLNLTGIDVEDIDDIPKLGPPLLPKLTRVSTYFPLLPKLIPNRSVSEVITYGYWNSEESVDLSFFTLSNAPILKLTISHTYLYPKPGKFWASIFPSLTHLKIEVTDSNLCTVREPSFIHV